jgi:hypothetical protein
MKRFLILAMAGSLGAAEPKKTRDEMVHDDRAALAESEAWVYNDLKKGFAEAEKMKKPLMVIHRCIP